MRNLTQRLDAGWEDRGRRYTDRRAKPSAGRGAPFKYVHSGLRMLQDRLLTYLAFPVF